MKTKTSELNGAALDWAVSIVTNPEWEPEDRWWNTIGYIDSGDPEDEPYAPSIDWAQGGPIIERERITTDYNHNDDVWEGFYSDRGMNDDYERGPTLLIAAMRCYVASELGDEVDIPEELLA